MKQAIICALVCVCALSGCIQRDSMGKSVDLYTGTETATETETARAEGSSSGESSVGSTCDMRQWDWDIEKYDWEECGEYTVVFGPDDLTPQEILCDNVFSSCQDGRENATIQELYRGLGEQWEHLWYTEYVLTTMENRTTSCCTIARIRKKEWISAAGTYGLPERNGDRSSCPGQLI